MAATDPVLKLFLLEASASAMRELAAALPDLLCTPLGVEIPLRDRAPEEVLALCLRLGITAGATRIGAGGRRG